LIAVIASSAKTTLELPIVAAAMMLMPLKTKIIVRIGLSRRCSIGYRSRMPVCLSRCLPRRVFPDLFATQFFNKSLRHRRKRNLLAAGCPLYPRNGHVQCKGRCLLWANSGHSVYSGRPAFRRPQPRQCAILVHPGQPTVADYVGSKYRRNFPRLAHAIPSGVQNAWWHC
jgi:hypothetical protein